MQYQKSLLALALAVTVFSTSAQAESTRDWGERALNIQATLDNDAPLHDTTWAGTHNSFANADDDNFNNDWLNQSMSLKKQLDAGIRQMVMDVHYESDAPRVCHNNLITWGVLECIDGYTGNRKLQNALGDVVEWINDGHGDQVVLIKIEMAKSGKNNINKVRKKIDNYDSYYYRPDAVSGLQSGDSSGCKILPSTLTKSTVLSAGKNIILFGDKCYGNGGFSGRVFSQGDNIVSDGLNSASKVAAADDNLISRVKDGATKGGFLVDSDLVGGSSVKMKPSNVQSFLSAGLNIVETYGFGAEGSAWKIDGEYPIAPQDLVWSWAEGWPSASAASNSVAMLSSATGRVYHRGSGNTRRAACRNISSGEWTVTNNLYNFAGAAQGCLSETGNNAVFSMPRNKVELDKLIAYRLLHLPTISDVYVNYEISSGKWVADIGE